MLCQLSYWPNVTPGDFVPPDPSTLTRGNPTIPLRSRGSLAPATRVNLSAYFDSLCAVCFRQKRQYLFISSRSELLRRFLVVL